MAIGRVCADSAAPITGQINRKTLVDYATGRLGERPLFWGRYFSNVSQPGDGEYRHAIEGETLRNSGIRVLPLAQQTERVRCGRSEGMADAVANVDDIMQSFGGDYLTSQGGELLVFLDVEGPPYRLSSEYYAGWASSLLARSREATNGALSLLPCLYAHQLDDATWDAMASAVAQGAECHGARVAHWLSQHTDENVQPGDFHRTSVNPKITMPCPILLWQYAGQIPDKNGVDFSQTNPDIDLEAALLRRTVLPPTAVPTAV